MIKALVFLLFIFVPTTYAATISDPILFEIYSGTAYISINNQVASFFNVSTTNHYLDINLNGTHINFTTTTNKTITGITYYNDVSTFTASETGTLIINIKVNKPLTIYGLYDGTAELSTEQSDENGNIKFDYNLGSGTYYFTIRQPKSTGSRGDTGGSLKPEQAIMTSSIYNRTTIPESAGEQAEENPIKTIDKAKVPISIILIFTMVLCGIMRYEKRHRIMRLKNIQK